ncbi:hypothetical protein ACR6HW_04605 [Fusibacter sp. JL298sf-3]
MKGIKLQNKTPKESEVICEPNLEEVGEELILMDNFGWVKQ